MSPAGFPHDEANATLAKMRERLLHRGPDAAGSWLDAEVGVALGHRRLSILDLSPAGHQPMLSRSGRYVLAFNGEIYNHLEIRRQLDSTGHHTWRGHSDTESLLAAIEVWGLERALKATVGMFAFALWDRQERVLSLARDRMGEKPLYYGWQSGVLLFGSELKALRFHPAFADEIDRDVIPLYLRHGYIPAPWSIWKGIRKLTSGSWISFTAKDLNQQPEPKSYWSLTDEAIKRQSIQYVGSCSDAVNELEKLLLQSISCQSTADVPLGAFLSGGIDSSLVAALMQAQSVRPIKTFTIGFNESGYNEAEHAKAVAKHLRTDHTELYVSHEDALRVIPLLPKIYDEPFADHSNIPTFLVSQLAREHVTVSLTGDGGDELFGGYTHYSTFENWHEKISQLPDFARQKIGAALKILPLINRSRHKRRVELMIGLLEAANPIAFYNTMNQRWLSSDKVLCSSLERSYWNTDGALNLKLNTSLDHVLIADMTTYLPDDILVKVDRAAMANSLETRVPLLDHRIVEYSLSLPQELKTGSGHEKKVLRQLLYKYVPRELVDRPKMGFSMPLGQWLKGPLRAWAEDLLSHEKIIEDGIFNPEPINKKWSEHVNEVTHWDNHLWSVLMFQAWMREIKIKN